MLDRLVENALDFLGRALDDLEDHPKFSLINFYTSVELFLKSRLMMEHWTLLVSSKNEPDLEKFKQGDFISVTLDAANERLTKVVQSGLSSQEFKEFKEVAKYRNKMVHFFHASSVKKENDEMRQSVVKQQLIAWYYLHRLLTGQWQASFDKWQRDISKIDRRLRSQNEFLKVVFDQKKEEITAKRKSGSLITKCPSCGFKAQIHDHALEELYEAECLVCGLVDRCINIECVDCNRPIRFVNEGFKSCKCGKAYEPEDLADALFDHGAAHVAAMDGDDSVSLGSCSDCDGYHTVVELKTGGYLCASCFGLFNALEYCEWCNEPNTGDMEHSGWNGCNHCDGRSG